MRPSFELVSFLARSENRVDVLLALAAEPRARPVGPVAYVALAVAVVGSAGLTWRRRTATSDTAAPSLTS